MVKPHAIRSVLDPMVIDALAGGETASRLDARDPLRNFIGRITLGNPAIKNLCSYPLGRDMLKLFYGDKRTRRYSPIIQSNYLGIVMFLPYEYNNLEINESQLFTSIKGSAETHDALGRKVTDATGIRGLFSIPYEYVNNHDAVQLDEVNYRRLFTPVVNNVIHVCDDPTESFTALRMLGI